MHTISMMACIQFCICQNQHDNKSGLCQKNEKENQTTQRNKMKCNERMMAKLFDKQNKCYRCYKIIQTTLHFWCRSLCTSTRMILTSSSSISFSFFFSFYFTIRILIKFNCAFALRQLNYEGRNHSQWTHNKWMFSNKCRNLFVFVVGVCNGAI